MTEAERASIFEAHRPRLLRLAYRMLGAMAEAEDAVQDAWLRWRKVEHAVEAPGAFLSRIVTRLCLDAMKSAHARRLTYVGAWLPEPLAGATQDEPADDLTFALMVSLERLSPLERAAFLLHDVFGVAMDEIAMTLRREPATVRQLAARARRHVREARPRYPVSREDGERIAEAFFTATQSGDIEALRALLLETVVLQADGGGKVTSFLNPIVGQDRVTRLFAALHRKGYGMTTRWPTWIDGLPGYVSRTHEGVLQTTALAIDDGRIAGIYITRNPDKLGGIARALVPL